LNIRKPIYLDFLQVISKNGIVAKTLQGTNIASNLLLITPENRTL